MSRTAKDAPRRVKERRLGIAKDQRNCSVCSQLTERTITTGFTAIFFAHETKEIEAFLELAQEAGYSSDTKEVRGYLGENGIESFFTFLSPIHSRGKSIFDGFFDIKRAVYSSPRGLAKNLLWNSAGRFKAREDVSRWIGRVYGDDSLDFLIEDRYAVSSKENIFKMVSISKTTTVTRYRHHYHEADGMSYLISGHCHCSRCDPDEKTAKTRVRAVTTELKKLFNGGDYDGLDEIAGELAAYSAGGYRDTMNC